jgi:hypothetical protein
MSAIAGTPAKAVMLARAGTPRTLHAAAGTSNRRADNNSRVFQESQMVKYIFVGVYCLLGPVPKVLYTLLYIIMYTVLYTLQYIRRERKMQRYHGDCSSA